MLRETDVEAALANCRALINQINAGLSAEEPVVDVSSATELLFILFCSSPSHSRESVGIRRPLSIISTITDGAAPANPSPREQVCLDRPSAFLSEDIGSVLKGGVNVCQRQLVNEVSLVTEFVRNFRREDATPIQRGLHGSLLVCI